MFIVDVHLQLAQCKAVETLLVTRAILDETLNYQLFLSPPLNVV